MNIKHKLFVAAFYATIPFAVVAGIVGIILTGRDYCETYAKFMVEFERGLK